jgi:hypothetical protein
MPDMVEDEAMERYFWVALRGCAAAGTYSAAAAASLDHNSRREGIAP